MGEIWFPYLLNPSYFNAPSLDLIPSGCPSDNIEIVDCFLMLIYYQMQNCFVFPTKITS